MTDTVALDALLDSLSLTISARFIPWSTSRSYVKDAKVTKRSLNWSVTVQRNGRDVVTVDYSAGIGHCPSYKASERWTTDYAAAIEHETETGRAARHNHRLGTFSGKPIEPKRLDVLYSLLSDADAIDYSTFEDWASNFGYDVDSRKSEATYRECLRIGLALRSAVGDEGMRQLRDAFQDH